MDAFVTLITNVGFPIACCIYLFINQNKLITTLSELSATMQGINSRLDNIEKAIDDIE